MWSGKEVRATDKYPLYLDGKAAGELTVTEAGMYMEFRAACRGGDGALLRAFLVGEKGEARLGVLAPEGGRLGIRRRLSRQEAGKLGKLLRCEARRDAETGWEAVGQPEGLLPAGWVSKQLQDVPGVLTQRAGALRRVAIPYDPQRPFPLAALFCFAKIQRIGGCVYAVYAFNEGEMPVMP